MVSPLDSVAQLGEHLSYKQKVIGSNPVRVITNYSLSAQIIVSGTCFGFFLNRLDLVSRNRKSIKDKNFMKQTIRVRLQTLVYFELALT